MVPLHTAISERQTGEARVLNHTLRLQYTEIYFLMHVRQFKFMVFFAKLRPHT